MVGSRPPAPCRRPSTTPPVCRRLLLPPRDHAARHTSHFFHTASGWPRSRNCCARTRSSCGASCRTRRWATTAPLWGPPAAWPTCEPSWQLPQATWMPWHPTCPSCRLHATRSGRTPPPSPHAAPTTASSTVRLLRRCRVALVGCVRLGYCPLPLPYCKLCPLGGQPPHPLEVAPNLPPCPPRHAPHCARDPRGAAADGHLLPLRQL